ncbi:MAG: sodium:alanine symporter family protein, partial [Parachlamydiaceae bacterium]|nr:sodium:alanine symporter family protein [Parachlamydiaceae bacterium]
VGVGNIVGICTAVQLGGPGALFWIWVTAIVGMILKYSEVYLGMRYRVKNEVTGGYNGGPMYFLQKAFKTPAIPVIVAGLLCIYGVEIYQFRTVAVSISTNLGGNELLICAIFIGMIFYAASGGVQRVGNISSAIIPLFVVLYLGMGFWVLINNLGAIPAALSEVFYEAFTGTAISGGLVGASLMKTISEGIRRGCYTGDIAIGYASVIHSESSSTQPQKQASLVIFDIFLDTFMICTTSVMLILVSGVWKEPMPTSMLVQTVLSQYFPFMHYFMPFFLFLLGYSTINAYFCVGIKCAEYISPRFGKRVYYGYALVALSLFSFVDPTQAQSVMMLAAGFLLILNCYGIFRLRKEISFDLDDPQASDYDSDDGDLNPSPIRVRI